MQALETCVQIPTTHIKMLGRHSIADQQPQSEVTKPGGSLGLAGQPG